MQNAVTENKVVIVSGATGNLGSAVVKKFISENYFVAATDVHDHAPGSFPAEKFESTVVNLNDADATQKFVDGVISKHNQIDAAVLTAGGFVVGKIVDTKIEDITKQYKLNFETAYNAAQPIFTQMLKQKSGRIFLIGSKPGLKAKEGKGKIAYSLAKALIFRLAELMNDEAKGTNVVVSVVVPGTIDTPQNREGMPDADFSKWTKAEDIANVIYWHCTDEAAVLRENIIKAYNYA